MDKKVFKAESKRLMDLMVNAIYTNKEIFLRELISNASDAIDKIYYKALTDEHMQFNASDYYIRLAVDNEARTLTISDTGIGMTAEELESNLGTIAKSGSFDFKEQQELDENYDIIGQFGVGFYASFMVADKVVVESRAFESDSAHRWTSEGADGYTIEPCNTPAEHGTVITLYLRENTEDDNYDDYLNPYILRDLVTRYSNYIRYPILMLREKSRPIPGTPEGETPEYETYYEDDTLNSMVPIWRRNKNDLADQDYKDFYHEKHFGFDEPLAHIHLNAEGTISYKAILYIPGQAPFDFYSREYEKGLALYSNGVLIMEKCGDLLPDYYSFVKGVVDSEDVSLNISREMLQQDRQLRLISRKIDERITRELNSMLENDRDTYETFFQAFGDQLKMGTYDHHGQHKDKLKDFLLFYSSKEQKLVTLKEYVARMPEDQPYIYYATGHSVEQIDRLPQVAIIKNREYEVLYLTKQFDEFVIKGLFAYDDKPFRSASSDQLGLEERSETPDDAQLDKSEKDEPLLDKLKGFLGDEVVRVKTTDLLTDDAVYLSTEGELSIDMEKVLNAMPHGGGVSAQKVLELNSKHPVYQKLKDLYAAGDDATLKTYAELLYDQARLIAGLPLKDAIQFTKAVSKLM